MLNQKRINKKICTLTLFGLCLSTQAFGVDLMQVYQQALINDPTFKEAQTTWLATRENIPISRSTLLPQIKAAGSTTRSRNDLEGGSWLYDNNYYNNNNTYSLNLTQTIFDYTNWMSVKNAKNTEKKARATFNAAAQDLMLRVAKAYLAILRAQDVLRFTQAQKTAVGNELSQTKKKYDVGLIPITGVNDAQASYDTQVAAEIAAKNDLADKKEQLREITKVYYDEIDPIASGLPLVSPVPVDIESWVVTAEKQNYSLQAARFGTLAAHDTIAMKEGGHLPTLNATGSYAYSRDDNSSGSGTAYRSREATAGLALSVPIFQGGGVSAQAWQAQHQYENAVATEDRTHSKVTSDTRQAYLGVVSDISKIKADQQEIKSKESALHTTQVAYEAGAGRTMVDVLSAQANLYAAQKAHATDQYDYLFQTLTLKQLAGILSPDDLQQINSWLQKKPVGVSAKVTTETPKIVQNKVSLKAKKTTVAAVTSIYALQFTASKNQKPLLKSLDRYQLKHKDTCSYPQKSNHSLMLCGHYTSVADAKMALSKLPKELRKAKISVVKQGENKKKPIPKQNHAKNKDNKINDL